MGRQDILFFWRYLVQSRRLDGYKYAYPPQQSSHSTLFNCSLTIVLSYNPPQQHSVQLVTYHPSSKNLVATSELLGSYGYPGLSSPHCAPAALFAMHLSFAMIFVVLACLASADVLNITTCYCVGSHFEEAGSHIYTQSGSFIAFDYYNLHLDKRFSLNVTRRSTGHLEMFKVPSTQPRMELTCGNFNDRNQLCYYRERNQHRGRFAFNGHIRLLPLQSHGAHRNRPEHAREICPEICIMEVGLPEVDQAKCNFATYKPKAICHNDPGKDCRWKVEKFDYLKGAGGVCGPILESCDKLKQASGGD